MTVTLMEQPSLTPAARRILDAASDLFYERGIHAVGVDTIAAAAGVTKKTLYDRFGSKEALVVSYLQHRDARWREHLAACLACTPEPGIERVLGVFDAAISWSTANSPKGCSAINARAELDDSQGGAVFPEVSGEKVWQLGLFTELCRDARVPDPDRMAQKLMLLYEGAIVTIGMGTFGSPFELARDVARALLEPRQVDVTAAQQP
ncbi:TetR/AcrR family transcriptional regulator [Mycetocola zhujimingii]|uniref:TetR/AcrR family transcriptional regulator n=1 Tax=Mycetocola zhujimingii TaxID=2079792 RepID=A0A2U1TEW1_9MICO|nr:TetR/AcrR family transcriptional regulator [Mycetocola zhujimingii]AWB85819.1 TetR/AcrR family transcriptional regulator [Mycetocola zhujimingii]PWC07406.1 TetR/AcrR family transcriptional regulator [Mycetocola zhujimingii]